MKSIDMDFGILEDFWVDGLSYRLLNKPDTDEWREFESRATWDGKDTRMLYGRAMRHLGATLMKIGKAPVAREVFLTGISGIKEHLLLVVFHRRWKYRR